VPLLRIGLFYYLLLDRQYIALKHLRSMSSGPPARSPACSILAIAPAIREKDNKPVQDTPRHLCQPRGVVAALASGQHKAHARVLLLLAHLDKHLPC